MFHLAYPQVSCSSKGVCALCGEVPHQQHGGCGRGCTRTREANESGYYSLLSGAKLRYVPSSETSVSCAYAYLTERPRQHTGRERAAAGAEGQAGYRSLLTVAQVRRAAVSHCSGNEHRALSPGRSSHAPILSLGLKWYKLSRGDSNGTHPDSTHAKHDQILKGIPSQRSTPSLQATASCDAENGRHSMHVMSRMKGLCSSMGSAK